jgi:hypothetical protein
LPRIRTDFHGLAEDDSCPSDWLLVPSDFPHS